MNHPPASRPLPQSRLVSRAVVAAALLGATTFAQSALILDQHNDAFISQGFSTPQQIGQSFVPDLPLLAAVELQINDQNLGDGNGFGAFIRILDGSLAGPVLGTSSTVEFPDTPAGPFSPTFAALFEFATPVALTPGNTYVIEVFPSATTLGSIGVFATGFNNDGYAKGTAFATVLTPNFEPTDLWFRTYAPVPEPATGGLVLGGLGLLAFALRRRAARSSG